MKFSLKEMKKILEKRPDLIPYLSNEEAFIKKLKERN